MDGVYKASLKATQQPNEEVSDFLCSEVGRVSQESTREIERLDIRIGAMDSVVRVK